MGALCFVPLFLKKTIDKEINLQYIFNMKDRKKANLQVRMEKDLYDELTKTAKKMGLNTSQLMRQIINEFVQNPKSKVVFKK